MAKVSARPLVLGLSQLRYDTSQQLDPRRWGHPTGTLFCREPPVLTWRAGKSTIVFLIL